MVAAVVVVATAAGVAVRLWLLSHLSLFSDEAVVGLMARQIDHGHFSTFYWGQKYGGAEPYVVAAAFALFGQGPLALNGTASVLALAAAGLAGLVAVELTGRRALGAAVAAVVWIWPYATVWNSVHEYGFRWVALCSGLALLWCALRLGRDPFRPWAAALAGLAAGVGWWASPEIVYYLVPAGVVLGVRWLPAVWRQHDRDGGRRGAAAPPAEGGWAERHPLALVAVALGGALVGMLPWLVANVRSGLASLRPSSVGVVGAPGYLARLGIFFHHVLPVQLGVQALGSGDWIGGPVLGPVLLGCLLAVTGAALAVVVVRLRGRQAVLPLAAVAAAVVVLPFLYAAFPGSAYWADGRYGVYLPPLVALLWAGACNGVRAPSARLLVAAGAVAGLLALTLAGASGVPLTSPSAFAAGWSDGSPAIHAVVRQMEADHLDAAYGDYWTAYDLTFLSGGRLAVSPSPLDVDRWPALAHQVATSPSVAWLFTDPAQASQARQAFGNGEKGPGAYDVAQFEGLLSAAHDPYRVYRLGVLWAVVPRHRVVLPRSG